jgi:hypothetical protein
MYVIEPTCGLCNKLRVIFSYYKFLKETKKDDNHLVVIWIKSSECPGDFLDYFEPIDNITFKYNNDKNLKINYKGYEIIKEYIPDYKELKLLPFIYEKIQNKINILGNNYISVHIRRTDHIKLAKKHNCYISDEKFIDFINNNNENNLYIATDNQETYNTFYNKYKNIVKFEYYSPINNLRQTTLEDSIIDMYMCIYSSKFMGSGYSSFSTTIKLIRNEKLDENNCELLNFKTKNLKKINNKIILLLKIKKN